MEQIAHRLLSSKAGLDSLMLRMPMGLMLTAHDRQKSFPWFGADGLEETGQFMDSLGL